MFAVEWLKQGVTVETETSALANLADAVATTERERTPSLRATRAKNRTASASWIRQGPFS
jgi:hypothetical protein